MSNSILSVDRLDEAKKTASLSLQANFSWTFVGNVVYAGSQWGMLVVLAKFGSPEMVGQFVLALAITAPVVIFSNLRLRAVQATDARHEYVFADYFGLRLVTTAIALLVIVGIVLILEYRRETALIILVVGMAKAFESISDVFHGLLQQHERMDRIAKSKMIKGPLSLVALGAGVYFTGSVFWGAVSLAVTWVLILIGYDIRSGALILKSIPLRSGAAPDEGHQGAILRPRWDMSTLTKLTWLALPLGIVAMLVSLKSNIPRYFIEQYLGERELGIFAALAYLMVIGNTVVLALGQAASPRLAKYYAAGNGPAFRTLLLRLVGIGALLGGAGVLAASVAGQEILTLLYGSEYTRHDLFLWVMIAAAISYVASFLGYGVTAARYFRAQLPFFALVVGASALVCLWSIPNDGLRGAAMALIIASLIHATGNLAIVVYALSTLDRHSGSR